MFGDKQGKKDRLAQIVDILRQHPEGLSQAEVARRLNVGRSTIARDLPALEDRGVLLQEHEDKLALFQRQLHL